MMMIAFVMGIAGSAWGSVSLSAFPDPVFREYLRSYDSGWTEYDSNGEPYTVGRDDGILGDKEIKRIIYISFYGDGIKSLKGIEYCTALTFLRCNEKQLTELDVSRCTALDSLNCSYSQLTELNVNNNTALGTLFCNDNRLTSLNVSGCLVLVYLDCNYNYLTSLDVSNNTVLTELHCYGNQLTTLDVSNNTALTSLLCGRNQLTELNLSNNTALMELRCEGQKRTGLKVKKTSSGYEVHMKDYVSHPENIDADSISPQPVSYSKDTGIITFSEPPTKLRYNYITHSPNNDLMDVTITNPLSIAALERSGFGTDGLIIHNMTDDSYLNYSGNPITESDIYGKPYTDYGKLGLAADGNSRLILRVQTDTPGTVSFSGYDEIGAKLEALTTRTEISASNQLDTSEIGYELYQVSAVLVAPESFPAGKKFPSDTFKVHVKFTDKDGEITEDDLELELHAAPVLLIPGMFNDAVKTFGGKSASGIWPQLRKSGFTVGRWNYYGAVSPSEALKGNYNSLYLRLWDMFDSMLRRGLYAQEPTS